VNHDYSPGQSKTQQSQPSNPCQYRCWSFWSRGWRMWLYRQLVLHYLGIGQGSFARPIGALTVSLAGP
jgi:hypothetical protein